MAQPSPKARCRSPLSRDLLETLEHAGLLDASGNRAPGDHGGLMMRPVATFMRTVRKTCAHPTRGCDSSATLSRGSGAPASRCRAAPRAYEEELAIAGSPRRSAQTGGPKSNRLHFFPSTLGPRNLFA